MNKTQKASSASEKATTNHIMEVINKWPTWKKEISKNIYQVDFNNDKKSK